jgi:pimeloyl-ACP methyl ester carboxylesterase
MFIRHEDAWFFTVSFGTGSRTILGLGGWTDSWELWAGPFTYLSQNWRTAAYDHRGSGVTLAPVESITRPRMTADVFAMMDALGIERCVLAGESAGAAIVLQAALERPERFDGLVLVDGLYYRPTLTEPDLFALGLRQDYPRTVGAFVEACVPEPDSEPIRHWGRQILMRASQAAAIQLYECMDGVDLRPQLSQIKLPTLILHGEADAILPVESSRWLATQLPNCQLHTFAGAGHVPTVTRPREVAELIDGMFGRKSL